MAIPRSITSLPSEPILEIASYLPFYDLYAFRLTNGWCHATLPALRIAPWYHTPWEQSHDDWNTDDISDEIVRIEKSTWYKDNHLLFCDNNGAPTIYFAEGMKCRRESVEWDDGKGGWGGKTCCECCVGSCTADKRKEESFWCEECREMSHIEGFGDEKLEDGGGLCYWCGDGGKRPLGHSKGKSEEKLVAIRAHEGDDCNGYRCTKTEDGGRGL